MRNKRNFPGTIYLNKNRYWWKVRLPGAEKTKALPLKPVGARYATAEKKVALEVARMMWKKALLEPQSGKNTKHLTIADLAHKYLEFSKTYYCDAEGKVSREPKNIWYALIPLVEFYPNLPAEDFESLKLKQIRQQMIERGWCRGVINQRVGTIKRMFRWAAEEQLIPAGTYHSIQVVAGLQRGRSGARETKPIEPVPEECVQVILPFTTPTVAAMIELQLLTGMRSTELCIMRPCDIETSGRIWYYRPSEHKTSYRGHDRLVPIGPAGQRILGPFLKHKLNAYCFSPTMSEKQRDPKRQPPRITGDKYNKDTYRRAVQYAIRAARRAGEDIADFHPHQLRHTAATKIRKEMGLDAARALLGHRNLKTTEGYAELDQALASKAALEFG